MGWEEGGGIPTRKPTETNANMRAWGFCPQGDPSKEWFIGEARAKKNTP
jgi:hypothetical protein